MNTAVPAAGRVIAATLSRELLSYRVNRFLHLHAGLMLAIGLGALFAPPAAAAQGTAWWVLNGVIYVASLSAVLLGLSSAQAETEEFALLFTQPLRPSCWVAGKCLGLAGALLPSAILLVLPTALAGADGAAPLLWGSALAAATVSVLFAWIGLALGLRIEDPVRGLIGALVAWSLLLFGSDLALIAIGGSAWVQANPAGWVAALMLNPLDAYRVMLLFTLEGAAFSGASLHGLTRWWLNHPVLWLALCLTLWCAVAALAAIRAAARQRRG